MTVECIQIVMKIAHYNTPDRNVSKSREASSTRLENKMKTDRIQLRSLHPQFVLISTWDILC